MTLLALGVPDSLNDTFLYFYWIHSSLTRRLQCSCSPPLLFAFITAKLKKKKKTLKAACINNKSTCVKPTGNY